MIYLQMKYLCHTNNNSFLFNPMKEYMQRTTFLKRCVIGLLLLTGTAWCEAKVKLPVLVSDGMVLQCEQPIRIWGWADPSEKVEVTFLKKKYAAVTDESGRWAVNLPATKAGGPYSMNINDIVLQDILVGDVWLCAGQSNMETPMSRIMDMFPDEILSYENTRIRYVKLQQDFSFAGPKSDIKPVSWHPVTQEHVMSMAGVPYFFAKSLYEKTNVPVGLVNTAVGGSPAEAWIGEDYLKEFPYYLLDKQICQADGYMEATNKLQHMRNQLYNQTLDSNDLGLKGNWKSPTLDDSQWATVDMFANWASDGVNWINGSHWLRKSFDVPAEQTGQPATLRLGCIINSDSVFVNGTFVGSTGYQYPPRVYQIPVGVLREGNNNITIRLFCSAGPASFVPEKPYKIIFGNREEVSLLGEWKHRVGCQLFPLPGGVSFSNKATVLYNAMIAPLKGMTFKGVIWYQGESNAGRHNEYYDLMSALIQNWRNLFGKPDLPFLLCQLPIFMEQRPYPGDSSWARLRDAQLKLSQHIPHVGLDVNIDLGDWNDIHPLNKKDVGYRLMLQAMKLVYGQNGFVADGPVYESQEIRGNEIVLSFREGTNDLQPVDELKGFAIAGADGKYQWAKARIDGHRVVVWNEAIAHPAVVRYAWADNPGAVNLRNKAGLPASPFQSIDNNTKAYRPATLSLHDNEGITAQ